MTEQTCAVTNDSSKGELQKANSFPVAPPPPIPYTIVKDETLFSGKWLGARQVTFIDPKTKTTQIWQSAFRTTTPTSAGADGVAVIAILKRNRGAKKERHLVLVKQYRIPMDSWTLEFPAGLLDANESSEEAGLRELKEETGYTATKVLHRTSGKQTLDPGLSNDTLNYIVVEIDGEDVRNVNPKQQLDASEDIEVVLLPCDQLLEIFDQYSTIGYSVEAFAYSFALGLQMGAQILE